MKDISYIFIGKGARVFVFGVVSVMTPIYVATLGYSSFYVGVVLAVILAGNIFSNILLTLYEGHMGRRRFLLLFSAFMSASGALLYLTTSLPLMLLACFIGNISTTGTEAGPFQSVETGILPSLVSDQKRNRAFGTYNLIGYGASSVGALAASAPAYFQDSSIVFRFLFLVYGLVGVLLFLLYLKLDRRGATIESFRDGGSRPGLTRIPTEARNDILRLSVLYSIDAFGGGFVSQSLLSYWFFLVYNVSLDSLGIIFLVVNVITALSTLGASILAEKLGNLRTMVYSHLLSNAFLICVPLAGNLLASLAFLFLRQSVSQMDVPTRQAFMAEVFNEEQRVSANAVTNTFRSVGSLPGAPLSGILLSSIALASAPLLIGGGAKIVYDLSIYSSYRRRVPKRTGKMTGNNSASREGPS